MKHFFCYDKELATYINKRGYKSVTTALSPTTYKKFTIFVRSPRLQKIIDEFTLRENS
ncbi:hypothetical protein KH172YL63_16410 [Bacillus sp. KH172YL63]|nr:hypothetical protein KH172YL63_16410 [Bacillus sp. KH172YL63]